MTSYAPGTTGNQGPMLYEQKPGQQGPMSYGQQMGAMQGQQMGFQGMSPPLVAAMGMMANRLGRPQSLGQMYPNDPYFAGRVNAAPAGPMGGQLAARAGQPMNPMGFLQGQMPPNVQQLFGAFQPQGLARTAPMQRAPVPMPQVPPGVMGDSMGGLLGGMGGGGLNPQIIQALAALFGGGRMGR